MKRSHIFLAVLSLLAVLSVCRGCINATAWPKGSFDFQYDAAKYIALGLNPYRETLNPSGLQEELGLELYYDVLAANQFPSMLIMLFPFTLFGPVEAKLIWCICNLVFTAGIILLVRPLFRNIKLYIALISLMLMGTPLRNNLGNGQHTIMAFFFFLLSLRLSDSNHRILSGIALAFSFFKYTLTIPLALIYIYRRKYKEISLAVFIHTALTVIACVWLRAPFSEMIILPLQISSKLASEGFYDLGNILGLEGVIVSALLFMMMCVYVWSAGPGRDEQVLAVLVMFSLAFVYHMVYDYFVLIIPLAVIMSGNSKPEKIMISLLSMYIFFINRIARGFAGHAFSLGLYYIFAGVFYVLLIHMLVTFASGHTKNPPE